MRHAQYLMLLTLGIDTRLSMESSLSGNYSRIKIYKALVQFYKVPCGLIREKPSAGGN